MSEVERVVVVGGGLAAGTAVRTLREEGWAGRVVLVGSERHHPYERPPLSKGYLAGDSTREEALVQATDWYAAHEVELRLGTTVTEVDRSGRRVVLDDGSHLPYDVLLLATGAEPRPLDVPGADLDGVHLLRTLDDSDRLRAAFAEGDRLVVVGGGWIGLETAAAARGAGLEVTVLEQTAQPLLRVLGPEMAGMFAALHREHGVDLRVETVVTGLVGDGGRVTGVEVVDRASGRSETLPADHVVVGVGVTPRTALADAAGLTVDGGVVVDEHLRTSDPAILAAGDVAAAYRPGLGRHLRVEHWANAIRQGEVAARTILGTGAVDERPPYFFTDQYDLGMEYVGYAEPQGGDVVVRGDVASREFIAFWLDEGRVVAAMNVNVWDVQEQLEAMVRSGRTVDPDRLADPHVSLDDV